MNATVTVDDRLATVRFLEQGRASVGFELKESYHAQAERNVALWRRRLAEASEDLFSLARVNGHPSP